MTAGGDWGKWIGGMGWGCVNLSSRAVSERVSLMSFNTAHLKGSGRIENACGGTGGRSPRVWDWSRTLPEDFRNAVRLSFRFGGRSGPYMRFGAGSFGTHRSLEALGPFRVSWVSLGLSWGYLGPVSGLSWGCLGPSWGCLGAALVCVGPSWGCLGAVLACLGPPLWDPGGQEAGSQQEGAPR